MICIVGSNPISLSFWEKTFFWGKEAISDMQLKTCFELLAWTKNYLLQLKIDHCHHVLLILGVIVYPIHLKDLKNW